jgi:phosphoribosylformylglycinamidine synthase
MRARDWPCDGWDRAVRQNQDEGQGKMKARVHVMLKNGVLDPQGEAVRHALGAMGFDKVTGVRQGKVIDLDLVEGATEADVAEMCEKLLANTVIERYEIELV